MPISVFSSQRQGGGLALIPKTSEGDLLSTVLADHLVHSTVPAPNYAIPNYPVTAYNINRLRRMIELLEVHIHAIDATYEDVSGGVNEITTVSSSCGKSGFLGIGSYESWNSNTNANIGGVSELSKQATAQTALPTYDTTLGIPSTLWTGKHFVYLDSQTGAVIPHEEVTGLSQDIPTDPFSDGSQYKHTQRTVLRIARRVIPAIYLPSGGSTNFDWKDPSTRTYKSVTTESGGALVNVGDAIDASHINQLRRSIEWLERHTHSFLLDYFDSAGINDDTVKIQAVWHGRQIEYFGDGHYTGDGRISLDESNAYLFGPTLIPFMDVYDSPDVQYAEADFIGVDASDISNSIYLTAAKLELTAGDVSDITLRLFIDIPTTQVQVAGRLQTETRTICRGFWQEYNFLTMWVSVDDSGPFNITADLSVEVPDPSGGGSTTTAVDLGEGIFILNAPDGSVDWKKGFQCIYWALPAEVTGTNYRVSRINLNIEDERSSGDKRHAYLSTMGVTQDLDFPQARDMEGVQTVGVQRVIHGDTKVPIVTPAVGVPSAHWTENGADQAMLRLENGTNLPRSIHVNELEDALYWMSVHEHELLFQYEDIAYFLEITRQEGGGCC